jgi:hypothetical protein
MGDRSVKLEELHIVFVKSGIDFDLLIEFLNTCRNIKTLTFHFWAEDNTDLIRNLQRLLPIFSQLEHLEMTSYAYINPYYLFNVINNSCPKLQTLTVQDEFEDSAEIYFRDTTVVLSYCNMLAKLSRKFDDIVKSLYTLFK